MPARLLPRDATKTLVVLDERWASAAWPHRDPRSPSLCAWPLVVAALRLGPPRPHLQQADWANAYPTCLRSDGRVSRVLTRCPRTGVWHLFGTPMLTFGQHDAVHLLGRLHDEITAAVPPPHSLQITHVDDALWISWPSVPDPAPTFAERWVAEGQARGLVARPEKCALSPSTRPRVFVGKLLLPAERSIASPPRHTATHITRVHQTLAQRTHLPLRTWQRLSGHLTWATAHTRYHRAACTAPIWRAFFRARPPGRPRRAIALTDGRRKAIMAAAAAAAAPLRGTIVLAATLRPPPHHTPLFPSTDPTLVFITDAQFHHRGGAGAITILSYSCFRAGKCSCQHSRASCRVLRLSVPLRYSGFQPHAESYVFYRAVAMCPPTIPVAALYSDCRVATLGLPKLRAPTRSSRLIALCSRLSTHLARSPTAYIADACPGGPDNPSDGDARARLRLQLSLSAHQHLPPTSTHTVSDNSWALIRKMQLGLNQP